jgi:hypothetical protein
MHFLYIEYMSFTVTHTIVAIEKQQYATICASREGSYFVHLGTIAEVTLT